MQTLVRGGGSGDLSGGNFSLSPWTHSQNFSVQVLALEWKLFTLEQFQGEVEVSILNDGNSPCRISLGEQSSISPWIVDPRNLLNARISQPLWFFSQEPTTLKILVRYRSEADEPTEQIGGIDLQILNGQFFTASRPEPISLKFPELIRGLPSHDFSFALIEGDQFSDFEWDAPNRNWDITADYIYSWNVWTPTTLTADNGFYERHIDFAFKPGKIYAIIAQEFFYYDEQFLFSLSWEQSTKILSLS